MKKFISAAMAVSACSVFIVGNLSGVCFQGISASAENSEWQEAYADFLKNGGYESYITVSGTPKFTTAYIDGDDIPELAIATDDAKDSRVMLATYKNGNITPVYYTGYDGSDTCNYSSHGGLSYNEKNNIFFANYFGATYGSDIVYSIGDDARANVEKNFYRSESNSPAKYTIDENEVTEAEYIENFDFYNHKMTETISYDDMFEITEENIKAQLGISDDKQDTEKETSGKCGDNAYWNFDESTATLTISGTGSTYDYDLGKEGNPDWWTGAKLYNIEHIVFEEGITRIGNMFFYGQSADVKLPESLEEIGNFAFHNSGFT